jgi:hypothetical protein
LKDVIEAHSPCIWIDTFLANGALGTNVSFRAETCTIAVKVKPCVLCSSCAIKVPAAELYGVPWIIQGVIALALGVNPNTSPSKTGLEALDTDNGKKKPEEPD